MKKILLSVLAFAPVLAFAQSTNFSNVQEGITSISLIINRLIPLVIGIAVLLFLIGVLKYVTAGGDEEAREAARGMIIFGIIALFVMTAVWGFVKILGSTIFGSGDVTTPPNLPQVPIRN
jgi:hypothetical protein